ncbi:MAG: vWA domain-containing protein [Acidimicrobiales bacterium]
MNRTPRTDARSFRATTARLLTLLLALTLAASACTSGSGSEGAAPTITTTDDDPTETGRGWLDGSPADADASFGGGDEEAMATAEGDMAMTTTMASGGEAAESADGARVVMEEPIDAGPPRAGSIDDNESFQDYLAYLERIAGLGLPVRAVDVSTQHRVVVTGTNGLPVAGLPVVVRQGDVEIGSVRTGADGIALLHPSAMAGWDGAGQLVAVASGVEVALDAPTVEIALDQPGGVDGAIALDVLFLIDATGSMGDEIERLKQTVEEVTRRASALDTPIDLRLALTVYRDEGDAYVSRTFDFTGDIDSFRQALSEVVAEGGGDYPEALDEALADALTKPSWRNPDTTIQLTFLLADAPPQVGRQVDQPYDASMTMAAERGIRIFPIASSDSDDQAEYVFRQLAQFTGARFVFLTYGVGGAALGESSDIESIDYEELPLEDLLVRLIAEELADLTGTDVALPPAQSTTTTTEQ